MPSKSLIRWSGLASIAGGVAWIFLCILFLLTHGSGSQDQKGTMFRLTSLVIDPKLDDDDFAAAECFYFLWGEHHDAECLSRMWRNDQPSGGALMADAIASSLTAQSAALASLISSGIRSQALWIRGSFRK